MKTLMELNFREKIWCQLFKIKFFREKVFYKLSRYKKKLQTLDKLNLNPNSVVLDIGGNNGVVSNYIYDKYRCNIEIYEPNPYCVIILKEIFFYYPKVKVYEAAISNKKSIKKLYYHKLETNLKNMSLSESSTLESIKSNISRKKFKKVRTENIKSILKKYKKINFLKIDIEGHEYKILPEIIKNLKKVDIIFCEMHGSKHRKEFENQYKLWKKKLKNIQNKKFFEW